MRWAFRHPEPHGQRRPEGVAAMPVANDAECRREGAGAHLRICQQLCREKVRGIEALTE